MNRSVAVIVVAVWAAVGSVGCAGGGGTNDGSCPDGQVRRGSECVPAGDAGVPLDQGGTVDQGKTVDQGGTADQGSRQDQTGLLPGSLVVFSDDYGDALSFADFGDAINSVTVDSTVQHGGAASLKIEVPSKDYTGGAIVAAEDLDLSRFDALTFWARASEAITLDKAGFGNDATAEGTAFSVEYTKIALTESFQKFIIPIPAPAKLTATRGLFHFAESAGTSPITIWIDDIRFEKLGSDAIGVPTANIATVTANLEPGKTTTVQGTTSTFTRNDVSQELVTAPAYFDFETSDKNVATVDAAGVVTAVGTGNATISAMLGSVTAAGALTVIVSEGAHPTVGAPEPPARDPNDVISLFSDAYANVSVDSWSTDWDQADFQDVVIDGNDAKRYDNVVFAGIEFKDPSVDATSMTHFHLDVWLPVAGTFKVKLVDFGGDGVYSPADQGGDDVEHELVFDSKTTPAITSGEWVGLDLPLASFTDLTTRAALAQLVLSVSDSGTMYVDNLYFFKKN